MEFLEDVDWGYELIDRLVQVLYKKSHDLFAFIITALFVDPKSLTGRRFQHCNTS